MFAAFNVSSYFILYMQKKMKKIYKNINKVNINKIKLLPVFHLYILKFYTFFFLIQEKDFHSDFDIKAHDH